MKFIIVAICLGRSKSDYFRIEINENIIINDVLEVSKSDYFRIEMPRSIHERRINISQNQTILGLKSLFTAFVYVL